MALGVGNAHILYSLVFGFSLSRRRKMVFYPWDFYPNYNAFVIRYIQWSRPWARMQGV